MVYLLYMSRYKYKKLYIWDNSLAYLTGLITADGCLINNNRHINVTSKDFEVIDIVQGILNINVKVSMKRNGYGGLSHHLQFSNVALYDFLLDTGLTPAKSKTMSQLVIPAAYYADFLRGYFDGDGTVYGYWDTRWKNSLMYYCGFTSASPAFLEWLSNMNERLIGTTPGKIKQNRGAQTLTYAKRDSQKLFQFMYYSFELPKLSRKYNKFIDFIERDPYANMVFPARVLEFGRQASLRD